MIKRQFWSQLIENVWKKRSIVWLSGVRRAGKTRLAQSLSNIDYYDCELPRVRRILEDPEAFLNEHKHKRVVLDEIHRLDNPSEILKIAADHFPTLKILATGSSTLGASSKFSDTLAGRKTNIWLTPLLSEEMSNFGNTQWHHRFLFGGLPPFFMSKQLEEPEFQEWIDAFWAKDIQNLFRLEKRHAFQKFTELLFSNSGSTFEATNYTAPCKVTRQTLMNYLSVLEATYAIHIIRPFTKSKNAEIVSMPKIYGFDTGFVCHTKGWLHLRPDDYGMLWEHCVLNEMQGKLQKRNILYWRDKQKREIDFIYQRGQQSNPIAIECKYSAKNFNPDTLKTFRKHYPKGENYIVSTDIDVSFKKKIGELTVEFVGLQDLVQKLKSS